MTSPAWPLVVTFGEMLLRLSPGDLPCLFQSEKMRANFGGAEANVAVALSHLDTWCEYVTRLPSNLVGDAALAALRTEGVQLSHVLRGSERMGLYLIEPGADVGNTRVVYDRGGSAFAAITPDLVDWPAILPDADWFHGTGITAALGDGPLATLAAGIAAARAHGIPASLDLNYRPALWQGRNPVPLVTPLVEGIDLLIANPHSARAMLGVDVADDALATPVGTRALSAELVDRFHCSRVALTRREVLDAATNRWSASLYDATSNELVTSRAWTVKVVDRIGSGDSFAASLIASLLHDREPADAIEFAVAASALKLRVPGDFNRVTFAEVDKLLRGVSVIGADVAEVLA